MGTYKIFYQTKKIKKVQFSDVKMNSDFNYLGFCNYPEFHNYCIIYFNSIKIYRTFVFDKMIFI